MVVGEVMRRPGKGGKEGSYGSDATRDTDIPGLAHLENTVKF